jgi:FkbM family methyltransferase
MIDTDSDRLQEFKHHSNLLLNAMGRLLRHSHPTVGREGSQGDEDAVLAELLPQPTGSYIDVGAGDPIECSNTWKFYERGWRGLLVECLPSAWHALLRHRPGDFLCPLAASDKAGFARLRVANSVSSIRSDWDMDEQAELVVETDTLMNILGPFPQIRENCSLLSIDVEGAESQVLKGIDFEAFKPRVIVIEKYRYHPDDVAKEAWHAANPGKTDDLSPDWAGLLDLYQRHWESDLNNIYVRK